MADDSVEAYLHALQKSLPRRAPLPESVTDRLKFLHITGDFESMVRLVREVMNLEVRLRVGWVMSGGPPGAPTAPAWVDLPDPMPPYATEAFRRLTLTMFVRKSFLAQGTYDEATVAIAHELAHVLLDAIGHPLRLQERAVDLTAMLLGFRRLYRSACHKEWISNGGIATQKLGYLTHEEIERADDLLARQQRDEKIVAFCRAYKRWLVAAACVLVAAAVALFAAIAAVMVA